MLFLHASNEWIRNLKHKKTYWNFKEKNLDENMLTGKNEKLKIKLDWICYWFLNYD